ncbi:MULTISPECIES: hypothetical protein [unclassified Imperialibacter]|uniref:hypothetical protein n=1 Tax=unclassified Imperialibacter TaxID=2629706 RepID=UPI00125ED675|nr:MULTISPECIES: hypothetical protein [unclassified Imperialibacter]
MMKKTIGLSLLVVLCEYAIYVWSGDVSPEPGIYFQLAARYSARVSFLLFAGILCWTGIRGLKHIYAEEQRRQLFVSLLFLLALNHLIHFYFLAMNFETRGMELREFKNLPGAVAYIVLTLSPFFLWNKKELTRSRYQIIISGFALVTALFIGTYVKRSLQNLEIPMSNYLIVGNLAILTSLVIINIFRIRSEKNLK